MKIILENIRSFSGRREIEIKPLTVVVGENSSGKTTFLSMVSAVLSPGFPASRNIFSLPPYDLGSYDTIATYKGRKYGRADHFSLGISLAEKDNVSDGLIATYINDHGQPVLSKIEGIAKDFKFICTYSKHEIKVSIEVKADDKEFRLEVGGKKPSSSQDVLRDLLFVILETITKEKDEEVEKFRKAVAPDKLFEHFSKLGMVRTESLSLSIAPIRTKPKRTYDETIEDFRPEGDHIPLLLARLYDQEDQEKQSELDHSLVAYGVDAGLFQRLRVKKLGDRPGSAFRIMVKSLGPENNLPDVGYGISQSLPIIVESVFAPKNKLLLVQQPEIHLHPRAQAALGSFFADLTANKGKRFLIETHSDYLIDRIRLEVANKRLNKDLFRILYFEKKGVTPKIHSLDVDDSGNLIKTPVGYRKFFVQEQIKLLNKY